MTAKETLAMDVDNVLMVSIRSRANVIKDLQETDAKQVRKYNSISEINALILESLEINIKYCTLESVCIRI